MASRRAHQVLVLVLLVVLASVHAERRRLPTEQEAMLLGLLAERQANITGEDNPRGVQGSLMDMLSKSECDVQVN